jgi:hypothetical protein
MLVAAAASLTGQDKATKAKLKELASLQTGLAVDLVPNPVRAVQWGRSGRNYTWLYRVTVTATGADTLTITEFGALSWREGTWNDVTSFSAAQFEDWFACPGARVVAGAPCSDPLTWVGSASLRPGRTLWYYIGVSPQGQRFKGEGVLEELAELEPADSAAAAGAPLRPTRIAVQRVSLPEPLEAKTEARQLMDSLIWARLDSMGYSLVPPDSAELLHQRAIDSLGGLFDPVTGDLDRRKARAVERCYLELLAREAGVDFSLAASVVVQPVPFHGAKAEWLGTSEGTGAPGGIGAALLGTYTGRLAGLNFKLVVTHRTGGEVYWRTTGIQLAQKIGKGDLVPVPVDSLLTDRARVTSAVERALQNVPDRVAVMRAE